jgi:rhodanese-related sulfurtransferase
MRPLQPHNLLLIVSAVIQAAADLWQKLFKKMGNGILLSGPDPRISSIAKVYDAFVNKIIIVGFLAILSFFAGLYLNPLHNVDYQMSSLPPKLFQELINTRKYTLIDIRTRDEFKSGYIKPAIQNDYYQTAAFSAFLDSLDKNARYLIYCRTGKRSANALKIMETKGFTQVADLAGGITAWSQANLPVVK